MNRDSFGLRFIRQLRYINGIVKTGGCALISVLQSKRNKIIKMNEKVIGMKRLLLALQERR